MKLKLLLNSMFGFRNVIILIVVMLFAYNIDNHAPGYPHIVYSVGASVYIAFVIQSLFSKDFKQNFEKKQKAKNIRRLSRKCNKLASEARKQSNPVYLKKLRKIMNDKTEIVNSYFRGTESFLKEKIVEQSLHLVISYLKLHTNYCIRSRELALANINDITNRINMNLRKINFAQDPYTKDDLKKTIEMDEKLLESLKQEKQELDRIATKLDYLESMVNMFKHQIITNIESEEMLEKLESVVNEASALDSVLDERHRSRLRI